MAYICPKKKAKTCFLTRIKTEEKATRKKHASDRPFVGYT